MTACLARVLLAALPGLGCAVEEPVQQHAQARPGSAADAERFWSDPWHDVEARLDEIEASGSSGLVLDGPRTVDLDRRTRLPLIAFRALRERHPAPFAFGEHGVLVAVDLQSGRTHAAIAAPPKRAGVRIPGGQGAEIGPASGVTIEQLELDVRAALQLPWKPGEYAIWMVSRHFTSNRITVRLHGGATSPSEAIGAPASATLEQPFAPADLPTERTGVFLNQPDESGRLTGWVRVPKTEPSEADQVAITLVVTGSARPAPITLTARVPVVEGPGGERQGSFAVRLSSFDPTLDTDPSNQLYLRAFVEEFVSEPLALPPTRGF